MFKERNGQPRPQGFFAELLNSDATAVDSFRGFPFWRPRVRGLVDWSYGEEGTWWFIDYDGTLHEYWYSW